MVKLPGISKGTEEERKKELSGSLIADREYIFPLTTYVEPKSANLFVQVTDGDGHPVPDAYLTWTCSMGKVEDMSSAKTNELGIGAATYCCDEIGESTIGLKVTKDGYEPVQLSTKINAVRSSVILEVINTPANVGEILVNDESAGIGTARVNMLKPGICWVRWSDVEGYVTPEPTKVYLNPVYSVAPVVVEGLYRKADEKRDEVKLTVFTLITFDSETGIPNPIPGAEVVLSDGQKGIADASGKVQFNVKADAGSLRLKVAHPTVYGTEEEITVNVGKKDLTVNVDFGPWFGGEETIDVSREIDDELSEETKSVYQDDDSS